QHSQCLIQFTYTTLFRSIVFRTKNKELKTLASSTSFTAIFGITEPVLYGVNLRYKRPLVAAMIGGGVGGLYYGITGVGRFAQIRSEEHTSELQSRFDIVC